MTRTFFTTDCALPRRRPCWPVAREERPRRRRRSHRRRRPRTRRSARPRQGKPAIPSEAGTAEPVPLEDSRFEPMPGTGGQARERLRQSSHLPPTAIERLRRTSGTRRAGSQGALRLRHGGAVAVARLMDLPFRRGPGLLQPDDRAEPPSPTLFTTGCMMPATCTLLVDEGMGGVTEIESIMALRRRLAPVRDPRTALALVVSAIRDVVPLFGDTETERRYVLEGRGTSPAERSRDEGDGEDRVAGRLRGTHVRPPRLRLHHDLEEVVFGGGPIWRGSPRSPGGPRWRICRDSASTDD